MRQNIRATSRTHRSPTDSRSHKRTPDNYPAESLREAQPIIGVLHQYPSSPFPLPHGAIRSTQLPGIKTNRKPLPHAIIDLLRQPVEHRIVPVTHQRTGNEHNVDETPHRLRLFVDRRVKPVRGRCTNDRTETRHSSIGTAYRRLHRHPRGERPEREPRLDTTR